MFCYTKFIHLVVTGEWVMKNTFRKKRAVIVLLGITLLGGSLLYTVFFTVPSFERTPPNNAPYRNASLGIEVRGEDLLGRMTEAEKIGQLALVEKSSIHNPEDITRYGLGAILSGGGGNPEPNTPKAWHDMVQSLQERALATRLSIPLLYGVDASHGHANVIGATVFPHAIGLGAAHDPDLVYRVAQVTARELLATGVRWNFVPNLDVVQDSRWGRSYESFGSNTDLVTQLGSAFVTGTHSVTSSEARVITTAKHFIGAGAMVWGSSSNKNFEIDQGDTIMNEDELRSVHLPPFKAAIDAGVQTVMVGLNSWNGRKLSTNHYLLTDLLKNELGFQGIVVSDWYGVSEIPGDNYQNLVTAVNAGVDMIMLPFDYQSFTEDYHHALQSGDILPERLDDSVRRVLRAKFSAGLFESPNTNDSELERVGSASNRAIAREAVQKSLVVLQDHERLLPLSSTTSHIIVDGSSSHNLGRQMGGWTVEWQGIDGNWVPDTTILDGITSVVAASTVVDHGLDDSLVQSQKKADIGIAVVGESPYAEGWGDNAHPSLSNEDLATIRRVKFASEHLVVVIVSGRPLELPPESIQWDAIVAAWFPGSEGEGVADVLFGKAPFTGTLPLPWPMERKENAVK